MHELAVGGKDIRVTDDNKEQYAVVKIDYMTREIVIDQLKALKRGMNSLIPQSSLKDFTVKEFEILLCGQPFIDVREWKETTVYRGSYHEEHKVIGWFWECMETYDQQKLSKFLQFSTGSSRLPPGGFKALEASRGGS